MKLIIKEKRMIIFQMMLILATLPLTALSLLDVVQSQQLVIDILNSRLVLHLMLMKLHRAVLTRRPKHIVLLIVKRLLYSNIQYMYKHIYIHMFIHIFIHIFMYISHCYSDNTAISFDRNQTIAFSSQSYSQYGWDYCFYYVCYQQFSY